jgi:hypothetical protein
VYEFEIVKMPEEFRQNELNNVLSNPSVIYKHTTYDPQNYSSLYSSKVRVKDTDAGKTLNTIVN